MNAPFLPRASLRDVVRRRAAVVGSRLDLEARRGFISPVEPRVLLGIPYGNLVTEEAKYFERRTLASDIGVVLRTAFAMAVAPSTEKKPDRNPWIVAARIDNISIEEALDQIFTPSAMMRARIVHFVHPHCLNVAYKNPSLAKQLADGDLTLPDGVGIRIAGRLLGVAMHHNVNGTDMWPALVQRAAELRIALVLVGAAPGVAQACAARLVRETPGLGVAIASNGFLSDEQSRALADEIGRLGRCLVLVGMGTPRQEAWVSTYLSEIPGVTAITVGGLFDFISGVAKRAPLAWREFGLEWAFRLIHEPLRLWRRYLVGNPLFLFRAIRQRLGYRLGPAAKS